VKLLRQAATVGSLTLLSRLLGFLRDAGIAAVLGAGIATDAFFVAFKLANLLRRLFAEGAFSAGFVPLFARTLEGEGRGAARRFAEEAFALLALILLLVVIAAEIAMPWVVRLLATGFDPGGPRYALAVELSHITFPYLLFISLGALLSGVLNGIGRFAAPAFAPVLLNLALLTALLAAALGLVLPARALAWGVAAAGVLQFALLWVVAARAGFALRLRPPRLSERTRRLFQLLLPGLFGAGVYQLNLLVDTWFASHLPEGAVSYLFYADRLNQLPLGAVGIALSTALLPALSRAIEFALLLTLPAATAFLAVPLVVVRGLFERGAFDAAASAATAAALAAFALGLPAYVLVKILASSFFAREDTRTPVQVAALCLLLNVLAILALIGPLAHAGIALATALANWANAGLLALLLYRQRALVIDPRLRRRVGRALLACAALALVLVLLARAAQDWTPVPRLALIVTGGLFAYFAAARLTGAVDFAELRMTLKPRTTVREGAEKGAPPLPPKAAAGYEDANPEGRIEDGWAGHERR